MEFQKKLEVWDVFSLRIQSEKEYENPFSESEVTVEAVFTLGENTISIEGFYDGEGDWVIRFMPEEVGEWHFKTSSSDVFLDGREGSFLSLPATGRNRGPVRPDKTRHFSYADQTPCFILGTTAYAWTYRPKQVREKTLESFMRNGFNKIRMLLTPKYYKGADGDVDISYEPPVYPFEGSPGKFDFSRFVPAYFRSYERRLFELMERGIEADVILFHFYDDGFFGIDRMNEEQSLYFLSYVIRRFAAFRNVWWSLANEYDVSNELDEAGKPLVRSRTNRRNWDILGEYIKAHDPYNHPRSIHNFPSGTIYPDRSWLTHVSYQHPNTYDLLMHLKREYKKPVINDEYQYEGNIKYEWGNNTAREEVFRHWLSVMAGGYATHGEVYKTPENNRDIFWTYGGEIIGESAPRLSYLRSLLEETPYRDMEPDYRTGDGIHYFGMRKGFDNYLIFCRNSLPHKNFYPGDAVSGYYHYRVEVYDVWNCKKVEEYEIHHQTAFQPKEWTLYRLERIPKQENGTVGK